jgi:hypothetical protein
MFTARARLTKPIEGNKLVWFEAHMKSGGTLYAIALKKDDLFYESPLPLSPGEDGTAGIKAIRLVTFEGEEAVPA